MSKILKLPKQIDSLYFKSSIRDLAIDLNSDKELTSVKTECGNMVIDNKIVQVQITITRNHEDFLPELQNIGIKSN